MIKNYNQFINEDIRSKTIIAPKEFTIDNLKREYPSLNINVTDFNVIIECDSLGLDKEFYKTLKKDNIKPEDIVFEDCEYIELFDVNKFTKISDYGEFGKNIQSFSCIRCENLTSLVGSPQKVSEYFSCGNCVKLTSLEGSPKEVGSFVCVSCENLTSLEGAPDVVTEDFNCNGCGSLTSLEGSPETIGGNFYCSGCKKLTSLDGSPEKVSGDFYCYVNSGEFIKLAKQKYGDKVIS